MVLGKHTSEQGFKKEANWEISYVEKKSCSGKKATFLRKQGYHLLRSSPDIGGQGKAQEITQSLLPEWDMPR